MPPSPDWLPLATFTVQLGTLIGAAGVAIAALWQAGQHGDAMKSKPGQIGSAVSPKAKVVEQLGSDKLETRLGGIYTLERISQESHREYWPIMETLTAFVRERAPLPLGGKLSGSSVDERSAKSHRPKSRRTRPN